MSDLDRAVDRLRQTNDERRQAIGAAGTPRTVDPFAVGARVFDRVTGLEGDVVARRTDTVVVSGQATPIEMVYVKLAGGGLAGRAKQELEPRPGRV